MSSSATDFAAATGVNIVVDEALWRGAVAPEGVLLSWTRAAGTRVEAGQKLAEVMIEGSRHDIEAPCAGVLADLSPSNAVIEPGDIIARLTDLA